MNPFGRLVQDVRAGRNLDIYITVIVALATALLANFGLADQVIISSAVLATLALVSVSLLQNRHGEEEIRDTLSKVQSVRRRADQFFEGRFNREALSELLANSKTAFLWGIDFRRTIPLLEFAIESGLGAGLSLRVLLLKPSGTAVQMEAFRQRGDTPANVDAALKSNVERLKQLHRSAAEGTLQIRVVDYLPAWTIIGVNEGLPSGEMLIRLSAFRTPSENRPSFRLAASVDEVWFKFFAGQFEAIWEAGEPLEGVPQAPQAVALNPPNPTESTGGSTS